MSSWCAALGRVCQPLVKSVRAMSVLSGVIARGWLDVVCLLIMLQKQTETNIERTENLYFYTSLHEKIGGENKTIAATWCISLCCLLSAVTMFAWCWSTTNISLVNGLAFFAVEFPPCGKCYKRPWPHTHTTHTTTHNNTRHSHKNASKEWSSSALLRANTDFSFSLSLSLSLSSSSPFSHRSLRSFTQAKPMSPKPPWPKISPNQWKSPTQKPSSSLVSAPHSVVENPQDSVSSTMMLPRSWNSSQNTERSVVDLLRPRELVVWKSRRRTRTKLRRVVVQVHGRQNVVQRKQRPSKIFSTILHNVFLCQFIICVYIALLSSFWCWRCRDDNDTHPPPHSTLDSCGRQW